MPAITRFSWDTHKDEPVAGTEDFVRVHAEYTGGYDWVSFHAFYSPSARRYFWSHESGCSCNGPLEYVDGPDDFENGDRDALLRAWDSWARDKSGDGYGGYLEPGEVLEGRMAIRDFKEP